jgi:hypothetical protein
VFNQQHGALWPDFSSGRLVYLHRAFDNLPSALSIKRHQVWEAEENANISTDLFEYKSLRLAQSHTRKPSAVVSVRGHYATYPGCEYILSIQVQSAFNDTQMTH